MKPRLSTTARAMLATALAHPHGWVVTESAVGRGPCGGKVRTGRRASATACALRDAGLLVLESRHTTARPQNGYTVHISDAVWSITDKGRALAAGGTR